MKRLLFVPVLLILAFSSALYGQSDEMGNTSKSLNMGSAKELVKNFDGMIELTIDGQSESYSKTRAEVVMKEFFKENPASSFKYIHQGGAGQGGLKYAIGKYSSSSNSYRVLIRFKEKDGKTFIYNMSFTKE